ncbi:MAG: helix-turn-helix domain-containing protein [Oscillospiraceae bacterium]|nr:helix-turn-helix domain-containing protein [Oscillospiraceae bacterium]
MSQIAISKKLAIVQGTYSGYETGEHNPDIDVLVKIADILQPSTDYLLGRFASRQE